MKTKNKIAKLAIPTIVVLLLIGGIVSVGADQQAANIRPISDFVNAQGTVCIPDGSGGCVIFVPPVKNYIGWSDPAKNINASIDYAGLADAWIKNASGGTVSFGTTTDGNIIERPLADGRVEDTVTLHTRKALIYVISGGDFANGPLLFGIRAQDALAGKNPALGDVLMQVVFINTAPLAPMPDLIQLIALPEEGQEFKSISITGTANGILPDGTNGKVTVTQIGNLFNKKFTGKTGDGFAVENINIQVLQK